MTTTDNKCPQIETPNIAPDHIFKTYLLKTKQIKQHSNVPTRQ